MTRVKERYIDVSASVEGEAVAFFDGRLQAVKIDERVRVRGVEFAQDVEVATTGALRLVASGRDESIVGRAPEATDRSSDAEAFTRHVLQERLRELAGDATVDSAVAALSRAEGRDAYDAWQRLAAVLSLSDDACARALAMARDAATPLALRTAIVDALGGAGTEAAQRALVEVLQGAPEPELRHASILGLAMAQATIDAGVDVLRKTAGGESSDALTSAALLGLGIVAHRQPARAESVATFLTEAASRSESAEWRTTCLEALGNAGGPIAAVERGLSDADATVRAAATHALRFVRDSRADERLVERLSDAPPVALAAVRALVVRENARALVGALARHPSAEVRREALAWLAGRVACDPSAREAVERAASSDASDDVRTLARQALTP